MGALTVDEEVAAAGSAPQNPGRLRDVAFLRRALAVWARYEVTRGVLQLKDKLEQVFDPKVRAMSPDERTERWKEQWVPTHAWAGKAIHSLAYELQGYHLKGAQFLGARPDLVPKGWVDALRPLQDACPEVSKEDVDAVVRQELGAAPADIFESFDENPLATGSIAQCHLATLPGGREVVVKVQRPGAEELVLRDLSNVQDFVSLPFIRKHIAWDVDAISSELSAQVAAEFDFELEARRMNFAADLLAMPPRMPSTGMRPSRARTYKSPVRVPRALPEYVSRRVLVMERLPGKQIHRSEKPKEDQADGGKPQTRKLNFFERRGAAMIYISLVETFGRMLLDGDAEGGLLHADPHPGNMLLDGTRVSLIDWGQAKSLGRPLQLQVARIVDCAARGDRAALVKAWDDMGLEYNAEGLSREELEDAVDALTHDLFDTAPLRKPYSASPLSPRHPSQMLGMSKLSQEVIFPARTIQYLKAFGKALGQDVSSIQAWAPHAQALLASEGEGGVHL